MLAGANLREALEGRALPPGVEPLGWCDDLATFWAAADVVLVPLRVGGGIKVKVLEALRAGALTVTTPIGAEGLPAAARDALLIAADGPAFVDAALQLSRDTTLRRAMLRRLALAGDALPTWDDAAACLVRHWQAVAGPAPRAIRTGTAGAVMV